jgi:hypothetical protein
MFLVRERSTPALGPAHYSVGTGILFRGQNDRGVKFSAYIRLLLRLRMGEAVPLIPLYAIMKLTGRKICLISVVLHFAQLF